jgi:AraC-like DNA-binding protein
MSNSHFFRRMHAETGTTFTELLTRYRLELACHLLRDTNLTIAAVSSKVSFKSPAYFQNLFRARMGCTPMEYRNDSVKKRREIHNL